MTTQPHNGLNSKATLIKKRKNLTTCIKKWRKCLPDWQSTFAIKQLFSTASVTSGSYSTLRVTMKWLRSTRCAQNCFSPFKTRCLLLRQAKVQYSKATSKQLGQRIRTMKFFTFANQRTIVAATKRSLKLGILGTCDPQFALAASFNPWKWWHLSQSSSLVTSLHIL